MAKEGISTIFMFVIAALILTFGSLLGSSPYLILLTIILWICVVFSCYFFRDPKRVSPKGNNVILAPADGKIINIQTVEENRYCKTKTQQIIIFLSLFDVHINRAPVSGSVEYFHYERGKFYPAYKEKSGNLNEQTSIGISTAEHKILIKQIAGKIARRIICHIREGVSITAGQKFGMIKFGSRVEIFVPATATLFVKNGDRLRAGETILGTFSNEQKRTTR